MTIEDRFSNFLAFEKRLSTSTVESYLSDLAQFSFYIGKDGGGERIEHVSTLLIRTWIVNLMERGIGSRSIHRKISSLRRFYTFLLREGLISQDPTQGLVLPKTDKKLPVFVEEDQMNDLLESDHFDPGFPGFRDRFLIEVLYGTGMRLSELIALNEGSIDQQSGLVRVIGKGNKVRLIPLPRPVVGLLQEYLSLRMDYFGHAHYDFLFLTNKGKKMYPKFVYRTVKRYLSYVTTVSKRSPHTIRHSYATHLLDRGADLNAIKELLGHSNLAATQIYTHTSLEKLKEIHRTAHPRADD